MATKMAVLPECPSCGTMMTFSLKALDDFRDIPKIYEVCPKCRDDLYIYTPESSPSYRKHRRVLTLVQLGKRRLESPPVDCSPWDS